LLLERKRQAEQSQRRIRYSDLVKAWNIRQSVIGTALQRGIKQYDYVLWKRGELQ
jgi:hypothetical protein